MTYAHYLLTLYSFNVINDQELIESLDLIENEPIAVIKFAMMMIAQGKK